MAPIDRSTLDPRADLSKHEPRNVELLLPMAVEAKRRRWTAKDFGAKIGEQWGRQASRDVRSGLRERLLVEADLRAALACLSEICLAVWGEKLEFTVNGVMTS